MPRLQGIPEQLKSGPFTVAHAEGLGFSRHRLRGPNWRRLGWGVYVWTGHEADAASELLALQSRLPERSVLSGRTAAKLHRMDVDANGSAEVTAPPGVALRPRPGICVNVAALDPADVMVSGGLRVTTPLRTCFDLARRLPLVDAVIVLDGALHRRLVSLRALCEYVGHVGSVRGVPAARRVVDLVEPKSESPMESRLRLVLILAGLPRPLAQVDLFDPARRFLGRPDLLYPDARLAIEYDGALHRDSLVADHRRQNRLQAAGYLLLRYTAADVYHRPHAIVDQVREQLAGRSSG